MLKPFFVFSLQVTYILELFIQSYGFVDIIYRFRGAYIGDVNTHMQYKERKAAQEKRNIEAHISHLE